MIALRVVGPLKTKTFEQVLSDFLTQHRKARGRWGALAIDLSRCSFIEAPAAAMLCALAHRLSQRRIQLTFEPPMCQDVGHYFEACGLERALSGEGLGARAGELASDSTFFLPVCRVVGAADVAAIGEFVYSAMLECIGASQSFASRTRSLFDALCENIVIHAQAGSGGWAAGQAHRMAGGRMFLRVGVVDTGVGIPATMAQRYPEFGERGAKTQLRAIEKATERGVTSRADGGGIGLAQVRQLVDECKGTLHVRSLSGLVTIGIYGIDRKAVERFPGTQLAVVLKP